MKVERVIDVFDKKSAELVHDISINFIKLEVLQEIFNPNVDDLKMYLNYEIGQNEANTLKSYINIVYDFSRFKYYLACYSAE